MLEPLDAATPGAELLSAQRNPGQAVDGHHIVRMTSGCAARPPLLCPAAACCMSTCFHARRQCTRASLTLKSFVDTSWTQVLMPFLADAGPQGVRVQYHSCTCCSPTRSSTSSCFASRCPPSRTRTTVDPIVSSTRCAAAMILVDLARPACHTASDAFRFHVRWPHPPLGWHTIWPPFPLLTRSD